MKNKYIHKLLLPITLALFALNFSQAFAQVMEITVIGGGYRLRGPDVITFGSVTASFSSTVSTSDIRDLDAQGEEIIGNNEALDYLAIEDQNGGNPFQVTVSATNFTAGTNSIDKSNFEIKNANGTGSNITTENASTSLIGTQLDSSTNSYVNLGSQRVLFTSQGRAPGAWRIFPVFRLTVPANTPPGTYASTLTFTVI